MLYDTDFQTSLSTVGASDLARARKRYYSYYSQADSISFPGYRPRHRILRSLCGVYPCERPLPDWWRQELPPLLAEQELRTLLAHVTNDDFYLGRLSDQLARELKQLGQRYDKTPPWARSPRLGKILLASLPGGASHPLYARYQDRGTKQHESDRAVIVSAHPWDILSMGCSRHFSTCQALDGENDDAKDYNDRLPANLLDSGMAVAYVPEADDDNRWELERMQARVILRLMRTRGGIWGVLIDRFYGDQGLCLAMEASLESLLKRAGLPRWVPAHYYRDWEVFHASEEGTVSVYGPLQDFSSYSTPDLDQNRFDDGFDWATIYAPRRRRWCMLRLAGYVLPLSKQPGAEALPPERSPSAAEQEAREEQLWPVPLAL